MAGDEAVGALEVGQAFDGSVSRLGAHDRAALVRQGNVLIARSSRDEGLALGIQGRELIDHERLKPVFERLSGTEHETRARGDTQVALTLMYVIHESAEIIEGTGMG